ncbi:MAG: CBS domain-containing protein [Proteobacteria bacterium]|nr:CBS domain-containing protein [Pseudomonadota bacterium]
MVVKEVMEREFLTVSPDMGVSEVAKIFLERGKDCALVIDKSGKLIGIVTETDLIFQEKNIHIPTFFTFMDSFIILENLSKLDEEIKKISASKVEEIMTSEDIITIGPDTPVNDAATIMIDKKVHHLPVVENGVPIGLITKESLLKALVREYEKKK